MAAQQTSINLLSKDEFSKSLVGTVLLWALSIGRYIIVFTQLVVVLSFLSRFKLDRDLTDLNTQIRQQQALIESYGDLEVKVRETQKKLSFLADMRIEVNPMDVLDTFTKITPVDVKFTQVQIRENQLQVSAVALSPSGFSGFVQAIQRGEDFSDVQLINVSSEEGGVGIYFDLRAIIGEEG